MKKLIIALFALIAFSARSFSQTYNPSLGTVSNKPYSPAQGFATDSRSMYFDPTYNLWRAYTSTSEVLSYLDLAKWRTGKFDIYITTGGSLSGGVITGGDTKVYWFKDGMSNSDLVLKSSVISVNGQVGIVVTKNADSLKGITVDTTVLRNNYVVAYDSTNRKFILMQPALGYTPGTGISIVGNVISAQASTAIWNANQLRGRNITTATPANGTAPVWTGTQFDFLPVAGTSRVIIGGYISNDTMYLVSSIDSVKIPNTASKRYVDSIVSNIQPPPLNFDVTFFGTGTGPDPIRADTVVYYFTYTQANAMRGTLNTRIDSVVNHWPSGGTSSGKVTLRNANVVGDTLMIRYNDSTFSVKRIVSGANINFGVGDSSITINGTPGTAEVNTDAFTLSASGTRAVGSGLVVDYILVFPTSDLVGIKMGTATNDAAYIFPAPCAGGKWTKIECDSYFPSSSTLYFSGITSSTQIKVHKQIQHE